MGGALVKGILRAKVCEAADIIVTSQPAADAQKLAEETGVSLATTNAEAARQADVVLLCVKPDDAHNALDSCTKELENKLLISIAAGLRIGKLELYATELEGVESEFSETGYDGVRVIRAMPNTAAMVGKSVTSIACSDTVTEADCQAAEKIFRAVGKVYFVKESQMDAVTGLSGSGPAFVYLMMEALSDGGVAAGLPRSLATELAIETVAGAVEMARGAHLAFLREMVTSPAGTTSAGLRRLEKSAVRSAFAEAVVSAAERSRELSK